MEQEDVASSSGVEKLEVCAALHEANLEQTIPD